MKDWLVLYPDGTTTVSFQIPIWVTRIMRKLHFFRELQDFGNISVIISLVVKETLAIVAQGK